MKTNELDKRLKEWAARNRPADAALADLDAKIRKALAAEPPPAEVRQPQAWAWLIQAVSGGWATTSPTNISGVSLPPSNGKASSGFMPSGVALMTTSKPEGSLLPA